MGTAKFHTDEGDVSSFSKQGKNCETKLHANEVFATNNMIISADIGQVQLSYTAISRKVVGKKCARDNPER